MCEHHTFEFDAFRADPASCIGKSFAERTEMFAEIMERFEAAQAHLSPEERLRRARIAESLDPRPDPWWKNFRKEALEEFQAMEPDEFQNLPGDNERT